MSARDETGRVFRKGEETMREFSSVDAEQVTLCEVLDRILNKGAVLIGEVRISVADIDLLYLGLQVVLSSVETARGMIDSSGSGMEPADEQG